MSVYVDDLKKLKHIKGQTGGNKGSWRFSHMIADTRRELDEMAETIGVDLRWKQNAGERTEHFDVTENMRLRALKAGAVQLTVRQLAERLADRDLKEYLEG